VELAIEMKPRPEPVGRPCDFRDGMLASTHELRSIVDMNYIKDLVLRARTITRVKICSFSIVLEGRAIWRRARVAREKRFTPWQELI
jgi:hypothetical protein